MNAILMSSHFYGTAGFTPAPVTTHPSSARYKPTKSDFVDTFYRAMKRLNEDTKLSSNPMDTVRHEAFAEIVSLGGKAVPLIIGLIQTEPGPIMLALPRLTGIDVVTPEIRGRNKKIAERWVDWFNEQ
jgi:hypothetical protein